MTRDDNNKNLGVSFILTVRVGIQSNFITYYERRQLAGRMLPRGQPIWIALLFRGFSTIEERYENSLEDAVYIGKYYL